MSVVVPLEIESAPSTPVPPTKKLPLRSAALSWSPAAQTFSSYRYEIWYWQLIKSDCRLVFVHPPVRMWLKMRPVFADAVPSMKVAEFGVAAARVGRGVEEIDVGDVVAVRRVAREELAVHLGAELRVGVVGRRAEELPSAP